MELNDIAAEVMKDVSVRSFQVFRDAVDSRQLVLTRDLYQSFNNDLAVHAHGAVAEISFLIYGRYKDMKTLKFAHMPPLEAMKAFVEKVGVEKFAYVPGYSDRSSVPTQTAINRIAFGIGKHFASVPVVRREIKKGWYNDEMGDLLKDASKQLSQKAREWIAKKVKETLEK